MSLMHDALKELDKPVTGAVGLESSGFMMGESKSDSSGKLKSILIGVLPLLLIGVAGAWWINRQDASQMLPPVTNASASESVAMAVTAKIGNDSIAAAAPAPMATPIPAVVADVVNASEKVIPAADNPVHKPIKRAAKPPKALLHGQAPLPAKASVPTAPSAEVIFPEFLSALDRGDAVAGRAQLDKLIAALPADSLTLLRAQAWYSVKTGDEVAAHHYYEALLERKAGDEEASINLAAIKSKMGQADSAMMILADAMRKNPDSAVLQQGLQKLRGGR